MLTVFIHCKRAHYLPNYPSKCSRTPSLNMHRLVVLCVWGVKAKACSLCSFIPAADSYFFRSDPAISYHQPSFLLGFLLLVNQSSLLTSSFLGRSPGPGTGTNAHL